MFRRLRLPAEVTRRVRRFDTVVDQGLDGIRGPAADRVFYTASALGDHGLMWHILSGVRALEGDRQLAEAIRLSVVLGIESLVVNVGVKSLFNRTRPIHEGLRPFALRTPLSSSFPSGHASAAFCAAVLLADAEPRMAPAWYGLAAVVATSRPYVRIHHGSDVAVGVVLGFALGHLAKRVVPIGTSRP